MSKAKKLTVKQRSERSRKGWVTRRLMASARPQAVAKIVDGLRAEGLTVTEITEKGKTNG
jgi:hypothetical protein